MVPRNREILGEILIETTVDDFIERHGLLVCCLLLDRQGGTIHGVKKELEAIKGDRICTATRFCYEHGICQCKEYGEETGKNPNNVSA